MPPVSESADERQARRQAVLAAIAGAGPGGVSGERLAERLGCSRASVHRHVEALRRGGIAIEGGAAGYRLAGEPDLVVPALVEPRLRPPIAGPLLWLSETGSTNDEATARARAGAPEGLVVGADHQRAGRGRRGRAWLAAPGDALLVSALVRPPLSPVEVGPLPLLAAVAVAEALAQVLPERAGEVGIAWPNDVLVGGRKLAGILCELSADQERVSWAVIGIGVNVRAAPALADARWTPAALAELGPAPARADLLVALLDALGRRYRDWLDNGPRGVLAAFAERDALAGRRLTLALEDGPLDGEALGIDAQGRLRLRAGGQERALAAGEVMRLHT